METVRINKYLADQGLCTRRAVDDLIRAGKVKINGEVAKLGAMVKTGDDVQTYNLSPRTYSYLAYHKPVGEITKERYQGPSLMKNLFPIGRLDKESRGLMILTNDGRLTDKLLSPDKEHEKEYLVTVDKPLREGDLRRFARGMLIEGEQTKPAVIDQESEDQFRIILTEGKKHQIRRMCAAWGYTVIDLIRLRIGQIELGNLKPGETRVIKNLI